MKRLWRQGPRYLEQFEVPSGGFLALCAGIVNQAIIDYNDAPKKSRHYRSAKRFLKEWRILRTKPKKERK